MFSLLTRAPSNTPDATTNSSLTSTSTNPNPSTTFSLPSSSSSPGISKTAAHLGGFTNRTLSPLSSSAAAALKKIHSYALKTRHLLRHTAPKHKRVHIFIVFLHVLLVSMLLYSGSNAEEVHRSRVLKGFECPVEDYLRTGCVGAKDCLYKIEGRCGEFVECRWPRSVKSNPLISASPRGTASAHADLTNLRVEVITMACPVYHNAPNWEWNDIRKRCDYPGTKGTCSWDGEEEEDTWKLMEETPHLGLVMKWIAEEIVFFWPRKALSWAL